ncbi:MAG: TonB-dependent receptor [Pseudomonadota bacterium]
MKRHLAYSAAFTLALLGAPQAFAQTETTSSSSTSESDTIVVRGVRASLQSSQDIKRNSDQVMDTIVAEDIGKLPDNNVIEALQHVTGVQVSRNAAEANQLLIRGLPDIATLVNGREIFTSTGRFITLQDIPAELLARVDVQKSARADDLEGGIAGVVDVHLHRPFDFQGLEVAGGAHATQSSLSGYNDPDASFLISDRWNTGAGEFGILFDVFYSKRHYKEEILDNYISTQSIPFASAPGGLAYIPLTEGAQSIPGDRERSAADLSLQWRPNEHTELFAEAFYTRYRNPNSNDFFVGLPWICADASTATIFPGTNEVHQVTAGCYDLTSNQSFVPHTDTYQVATGGTWTGDRLTMTTELDYTNSRFGQTGYILDTEYYPPSDGYTADFNYHGQGTPYMNVTGVDLTDPSQYHMRQFYDQWTKQRGHEADWRGDITYDMGDSGFFRQFQAGLRYANRIASNRADNPGGLDCRGVADPGSPTHDAVAAAIASSACFKALNDPSLPGVPYHVTAGSQFNAAFGISQWMDADPNWLNANIGFLRTLFGQSPTGAAPPEDPTQSFDDREISYAGYGKANFGFNLGSIPVDGNIGLRVVETNSTLRGNTLVISQVSPGVFTFTYSGTESKTDTTDWLPSLNARLQLQSDLFLRFGVSRTVTHPQFAQLNPGLSLSNSTATLLGSGSSGNPDLNPVTSDNADLTLEYYFGPQSNVTGAVFYRRIDGYIEGANTSEVIAGVTYNITRPVNASPGDISGVELGYTQFFDFLPGVFSGLGLQTNATYVSGDFQNISKWSYNVVAIYEKGPLSMRAAYNWRDGFNAGAAPGGGQNPGTIFAKSQPWLDFSASYALNDRLTATFDATNLLDSYYQDYFGDPNAYPRDTRRFDQTLAVGLRYRY